MWSWITPNHAIEKRESTLAIGNLAISQLLSEKLVIPKNPESDNDAAPCVPFHRRAGFLGSWIPTDSLEEFGAK